VVFDLGGTLIDYRGGSDRWPAMERPGIESLHTCLTAAGYLLDADLFHDAFVRAMDARWQAATAGMGDPPTLHSLILEVCSAAGHNLADDVHQAAVAAYHQPIAAQAVTRHGATDVLGWLQAHGVRLGLISNSVWPGDAHRLDLERHGLAQFLDFTVFSSECGLWKPNPAIFWHVLERLGVDPMHAAFVGDRFAEDIGGAQAAGLHPVYIEGTTDYEHIDPAAYHPEARITSLAELPAALRRIFS
jgi:putative hydrolase of the HAD superfamily